MKKIDELLARFGLWLALRTKTLTATSIMSTENTRKMRCGHCGFSPIHYLENCECKSRQLKK